jgi:hypothetical protein
LLQSTLHDEATDGRSWLLVVDEAHRGSVQVWDEIHSFRNQFGLKTGFAGLFVLGQTELARALATRRFSGFATSLQATLHLLPIDLDEARELLSFELRDEIGGEHLLEELHRDARGNPGKLLRLADTRPPTSRPNRVEALNPEFSGSAPAVPRSATTRFEMPAFAALKVESTADPSVAHGGHNRMNSPPLIPARPPIRLEDGLVEVGWEGDLDSEPAGEEEAATATESPRPCPDDAAFNEELIEDRYAALQAWSEWTRNQGRMASEGAAVPAREIEPSSVEEATEVAVASKPSSASEPSVDMELANLRAESQHDFAPYSQLFTRPRQSR